MESKSVLKVDNKPPETTIVKVDLASEKGNINSLEAKIGNLDKDYNVGLNDVTLDLRNAIAAVIEGIREPEDKADQAAPLGKAEKADVGILKDIPNALLLELKKDINVVIEI